MIDFRDVDWHTEAARGCEGKRRHGWETARRVAAARRAGGVLVRAYRCPWCASWHVGHVPSVEGLERIAAAMRSRTNEGPEAA